MNVDPDEDLIAEVDVELANQNVSHDNYQGSISDKDGVIKYSVAYHMWLNYG